MLEKCPFAVLLVGLDGVYACERHAAASCYSNPTAALHSPW